MPKILRDSFLDKGNHLDVTTRSKKSKNHKVIRGPGTLRWFFYGEGDLLNLWGQNLRAGSAHEDYLPLVIILALPSVLYNLQILKIAPWQ